MKSSSLVLFFCVFAVASFFPSEASARRRRPLGIMMELSRTRDDMVRQFNEETSSYEDVKSALISGRIERGQKAEEIASEYGEPVIVTTRSDIDAWVYKPGEKSFFDGVKIYLYFDADGKLLGWEDLTTP